MPPCLTSWCPCRGAPAQAPRQWQSEVRQGDTHDGGPPLSGCPLAKPATQYWRWPMMVKALRLGRRSGSLWITGVCRHVVPTLRSQRPITATTHIHATSQSRCVPFSDPHVHTVARSTDTRQECTHNSAKTMGPVHHLGWTHQADEGAQRKENGGSTSAKGCVLRLTCVPLPHLVLPLSGCACPGTPIMATRGEAIATGLAM